VTNKLSASTSPYLRQHRDNPVHWWEWCDEAFAEAQARDVPVLLSVGYSACHWCHVMAHESFEDTATAEVMNSGFVCIKVDREERPDIDSIYMDAVQALTGRGGWPMTVFLTPRAEPFYGGTYYPRQTFVSLMNAVTDAWQTKRDELQQNVAALIDMVGRSAQAQLAESYNALGLFAGARDAIVDAFDATRGGFGGAPKFPSTFAIDLLLRHALLNNDTRALNAATVSLDAMASGGINDHLGGGFARYSVDDIWLVPHFEKMLYDQAQFARAYLHAWQVTERPEYLQVLAETISYVLADLAHPNGAFLCAEDADSPTPDGHNEEGWFYTWTPQEIEDVLGPDAPEFMQWYHVTNEGNFEGRNILHRIPERSLTIRPAHIDRMAQRLVEHRATRPRPGLDDKVITEWSAMMLSVLAEAALATNNQEWELSAIRAARDMMTRLRVDKQRWARTPDGKPALAIDLAHVIDAYTRVFELTGEREWLSVAHDAAVDLIERFDDFEGGGFFTVAIDSPPLLVRQKDLFDNATASANSTAALALLRLGALLGEPGFTDAASRALRLLAPIADRAPSAMANAISVIHTAHMGITEVLLPGPRGEFVHAVSAAWRPSVVTAHGDGWDSPLWNGRVVGQAYVCKNQACERPVDNTRALLELLTTTHGE
jgi:hypothetical protein